MFLNRRSERPHAVLGVLPGCWRGLSGTPLGATSVLEEATWAGATKSTPTVSARRTPRSSSSSGYFLDRGITWSSLLEGQIPKSLVSRSPRKPAWLTICGVWARFRAAQGCLGHRAAGGEERPVDPDHGVLLQQALAPDLADLVSAHEVAASPAGCRSVVLFVQTGRRRQGRVGGPELWWSTRLATAAGVGWGRWDRGRTLALAASVRPAGSQSVFSRGRRGRAV